jgi:hypothetical protein
MRAKKVAHGRLMDACEVIAIMASVLFEMTVQDGDTSTAPDAGGCER